jgi:hypothetical protein
MLNVVSKRKYMINRGQPSLIQFGLRLPYQLGLEIKDLALKEGKSYNLFLVELITESMLRFRSPSGIEDE